MNHAVFWFFVIGLLGAMAFELVQSPLFWTLCGIALFIHLMAKYGRESAARTLEATKKREKEQQDLRHKRGMELIIHREAEEQRSKELARIEKEEANRLFKANQLKRELEALHDRSFDNFIKVEFSQGPSGNVRIEYEYGTTVIESELYIIKSEGGFVDNLDDKKSYELIHKVRCNERTNFFKKGENGKGRMKATLHDVPRKGGNMTVHYTAIIFQRVINPSNLKEVRFESLMINTKSFTEYSAQNPITKAQAQKLKRKQEEIAKKIRATSIDKNYDEFEGQESLASKYKKEIDELKKSQSFEETEKKVDGLMAELRKENIHNPHNLLLLEQHIYTQEALEVEQDTDMDDYI